MPIVYPYGSDEVTVPATQSIAVATKGDGIAKVYQKVGYPNYPDSFDLLGTVQNAETVFGAFSAGATIIVTATVDQVEYEVGASPAVNDNLGIQNGSASTIITGDAGENAFALNVTRNTIADTGTLTDAQHQAQVIYQDASGGNVTCTTRTGAQLAAFFPDLAVGNAIALYHASNHATNTSTLSGDTGVTLVGSGAVVNTGGQYLLIKTGAATFDLVRVG